MKVIKLNSTEYPVAFTIKALHDFAKSQGIDLVEQSLTSLAFLTKFKKGYKIEIDDLDKVTSLTVAAINAGARKQGKPVNVDFDSIYDALIKEPEALSVVLAEVVDSMNEYLETFAGTNEKKKELTKSA